MTTIFEPGKTYKTRDGRNALIYCVDAPGRFPVHGRTDDGYVKSWTLEGGCMTISTNDSADLMPPEPERINGMYYINTRNGKPYGKCYYTEAEAKIAFRIICSGENRCAVPCRLVEIVGDARVDGERHRV